jgi:hypothetical protein
MSIMRTAILAVGLLTSACSSSVQDWGPLAVVDSDPRGSVEVLGGRGVVTITDRCVTLLRESDGRPVALVFRAADVRWEAITQRILFTRPHEKTLSIRSGDVIEIGGAGTPSDPWVKRSDASCPTDAFAVHSVTPG